MQGQHRVLILPGWQNSGPAHWQSRWQDLHGFHRVEQANWDWPLRGDWMMRLEEAVRAEARPTSLVAHSLGCHLVAAWAAHASDTSSVTGALLVAPPDTAREDMPPQLASWRHIVRQRLPFKALVAYSSSDPFCTADRALEMAADWGASVLSMGAAGHVNADTGLGDWPDGLDLIRQLQASA